MTLGPDILPRMNEIAAIKRVRSRHAILSDIDAQHAIIAAYAHLAVEYHNVDVRPMIFDGETVQRIGPDPVPQELRDQIAAERTRLREFEHELYEATQRDHMITYDGTYDTYRA